MLRDFFQSFICCFDLAIAVSLPFETDTSRLYNSSKRCFISSFVIEELELEGETYTSILASDELPPVTVILPPEVLASMFLTDSPLSDFVR